MQVSSGMTVSTQAVMTILAGRRSVGDARVAGPGRLLRDHGRDAGEQVGHPDEVAEDEVPVEADERQQLLEHLQVRQGDDEQQDLRGWPRRRRPARA